MTVYYYITPSAQLEYHPSMGHGDLQIKKTACKRRFHIAPSARLEHATYCSASKRSNPLSYEGKQGGILTRLDRLVKSMEHFVNC